MNQEAALKWAERLDHVDKHHTFDPFLSDERASDRHLHHPLGVLAELYDPRGAHLAIGGGVDPGDWFGVSGATVQKAEMRTNGVVPVMDGFDISFFEWVVTKCSSHAQAAHFVRENYEVI